MTLFRSLIISALLVLIGCASSPTNSPPPILHAQSSARAFSVITPPVTHIVNRDVTFEWLPSPDPDASKYTLYCGLSSRDYDTVVETGPACYGQIKNMIGGATYYLAALAENDDGSENSGYSEEYVYRVPLQIDLAFSFDVPVANISVQCSSNLSTWENCTLTESNGMFRVTPKQDEPMMIYRATGTPQTGLP